MNDDWREARRILAVRLDNLGDVLVTTPAIHAIAASLPRAEITLLAGSVGAQAGYLNPDIADVIVYEAPWMDPWRRRPQDSVREQAMIRALKEREFDAAIIFTSFRQSPLPAAYLCYLADIPLRAAASIDGPGSLLTTRHKHPDRPMHEVERGLDLAAAVGCHTNERDLVLKVPGKARAAVRPLLAQIDMTEQYAGAGRTGPVGLGDGSGPVIVVHAGCSMPARTYPWEMFAAAADLLIERLGATVILTGSEAEAELTGRIAARMSRRPLDLAGRLSFPELCALIEAADLTVTNNTGPMHIAAAVKTPVVALFALTNPPQQWGPWQVPHRLLYHDVPCRICYSRICPYTHDCLRLVEPEAVVAAALDLMTVPLGAAS